MRRTEPDELPLMEATVRLHALEQLSDMFQPRAEPWLRPMLRRMIQSLANLVPGW
jgi:hypothetical protein